MAHRFDVESVVDRPAVDREEAIARAQAGVILRRSWSDRTNDGAVGAEIDILDPLRLGPGEPSGFYLGCPCLECKLSG